MNTVHMKYFSTVAHLEHITQATEVLHLTQPALSKSIIKVEEEIGVPLFDRVGRNIQLNAYGKIALQHIDNILFELETLGQEITEMRQELAASVLIASSIPIFKEETDIEKCLSQFFSNNKQAIYRNLRTNNAGVLQALESGSAELGFSNTPVESALVMWIPLQKVPLGIRLSVEHPLAKRDSISMDDLRNCDVVCSYFNSSQHNMLMELYQRCGMFPKLHFEGDQPVRIDEAIMDKHMIHFCTESKFGDLNTQVKGTSAETNIIFRRINDSRCHTYVGLSVRRDMKISTIAKQLYDDILQFFHVKDLTS